MATQTALCLDGIGKPLKKVLIPIPTPKDNQVLLKVIAAGLDPMDHMVRDDFADMARTFHRGPEKYPAILGFDIVGTVVSNGPNSSIPIGTHVFSQSIITDCSSGGMQEYTVVDARWAVPVPSNISDIEASVFPVNTFTAGLSLFSANGLGLPLPGTPESKAFDYAAQSVVVIGAGTNVGRFAIQFLRIAGIGKIIAVASLSGADELKRQGTTHVVSRRAEDVNAEVRKIIGDELLYVLDAFNGGPELSLGVSMLSNSKKGTLIHLVPYITISEEVRKTKKAGFEERDVYGASEGNPEFAGPFCKEFANWLESGEVEVTKYQLIEGLDVEKINAAVDEYRDRKTKAKWTIKL